MILLPVLAGAALIFAALRDIFHELFHPAGSGTPRRLPSLREGLQ